MKKSIFFKVFGGSLALLVALSALFLLFSFGSIRKHYLEFLTADLEKLGRILSPQIIDYLSAGRIPELDSYLKQKGKDIRTRITVVGPEGAVLADSEEDPRTMESHKFRPEIFEALQGRIGHSLRYSSTVKEEMLYVALPLAEGGGPPGALRISLFISDIKVLLSAVKMDIGRAVAIMVALSVLIAYVFSRNLTRPLRSLAKASEKVAAGDFDVKVSIRTRDEWRDLAKSFNAMTQEIKTLFTDLKIKKEELDNIIASMQEGLIVLDRDDRIFLLNESARRILGHAAPEGKPYWEVIRATPFVELVREARKERQSPRREISLAERSYLCHAFFLPSQERLIVTMNDVTEVQNWGRMKKDLVVNVSHELRTPLTAIKGFAEALEDEVEEKGRNYARTIVRNTDRLIRIVEDLLSLSELEEQQVCLEREKVNLGRLAADLLKTFEPRAREKGLALRLDSEPSLPAVEGDSFRLEQLLANLVDNAVKYTEKGEISVSLWGGEDSVTVEVSDTGIGIPEEDQVRVFERFYVVDKSRSRKMGGTGLGLSIVKHIVLLHGGKIRLESKPGAGSRFIITLPLLLAAPILTENSP